MGFLRLLGGLTGRQAIGHHVVIGLTGGESRRSERGLIGRIGENLRFHHDRIALAIDAVGLAVAGAVRSEEHTSELQSLMRISYAVFCLKKKNLKQIT